MIHVKWTVSGHRVDKPIERLLQLDESANAFESPSGDILKVGDLNGDQLEHYVTEKYIKPGGDFGRVISLSVKRDAIVKSSRVQNH